MRHICRSCRTTIDIGDALCPACGKALTKRSRISVPVIGSGEIRHAVESAAFNEVPEAAPLAPEQTEPALGSASDMATRSGPVQRVVRKKRKSHKRTFDAVNLRDVVAQPEAPSRSDLASDDDVSADMSQSRPESGQDLMDEPDSPSSDASSSNTIALIRCPSCDHEVLPSAAACNSCFKQLGIPFVVDPRPHTLDNSDGREPHRSDHHSWSDRVRAGGRDIRHGSVISRNSKIGLGAVLAAMVAIVALVVGPLRPHLGGLLGPSKRTIDYEVTVLNISDEDVLTDLTYLRDDSFETAVHIPWPDGAASQSCDAETGPGLIVIAEPGPHPAQLRIFVSYQPADAVESSRLWPGPKIVSLVGSAGCQQYELSIETGFNDLSLEGVVGEDRQVTVLIHSRWEDEDFESNRVVTIAELRVES